MTATTAALTSTGTATTTVQQKETNSSLLLYSLVMIISITCYVNSLNGDFVHDDIPAISFNPDVTGTTSITQLCKNDFWGTPMSDINSHKSYRPLTVFTFRLNNWLFGSQPFWFHFGNVALHAICSGLFTRLAVAVAGLQLRFAAFAGAMFASHPIHTEAVAGVVGRADILACFFFILSVLTYHDYKWRWRWRYGGNRIVLSCAFASASLLAKETGMTVLLVNLFYDTYVSWTSIKKTILEMKCNEETILFCRRICILTTVIIILIIVRLALLQGTLPTFSSQDNPAAFHPLSNVRFLTYSYLAVFNFWLLLFPYSLSHDWQMGSIPLISNLSDQRNIFTFVFFLCFCWLLYRIVLDFEHQRQAPVILGFLFLVAPFLPASNLLFTVGFVVAERLLYIPSMGIILLIVYGGQILSHKIAVVFQKNWPLTVNFLILIVLFVSKTIHRNQDWKNRESLIKAALTVVPNNAKMHYNWANLLRENGQRELSVMHYKEALRLWPSYASAYNNLGTLMKAPEDAESYFLSAIKYSPNHVNAHYNLGHVYRRMNKTGKAISMLQKCLHLNNKYVGAYILLAKIYGGHVSGRLLRHTTKIQSENANYYVYYARWLHKRHRYLEAVYNYRKALKLCPTHRSSLIGLAHVYRDMGYFSKLESILIRYYASRYRSSSSLPKIPSPPVVNIYTLYLQPKQLKKQQCEHTCRTTSIAIATATTSISTRTCTSNTIADADAEAAAKRTIMTMTTAAAASFTENSSVQNFVTACNNAPVPAAINLQQTSQNLRAISSDEALQQQRCEENLKNCADLEKVSSVMPSTRKLLQ